MTAVFGVPYNPIPMDQFVGSNLLDKFSPITVPTLGTDSVNSHLELVPITGRGGARSGRGRGQGRRGGRGGRGRSSLAISTTAPQSNEAVTPRRSSRAKAAVPSRLHD